MIVLALADHGEDRRGRSVRAVLAIAAVVTGAIAIATVLGQGDGYIPLLGSAKDLELLDKPQSRRFAAGLEDFGYQVFPWAGLILVGATLGARDSERRWPALWLVTVLTATAGWSMLYGPTPIFVTIPAAVCAATAVESFLDPERSGWERRIALFITAATAMAMPQPGRARAGACLAVRGFSDWPTGSVGRSNASIDWVC